MYAVSVNAQEGAKMELMNYGYLIYMLRALNTFYQPRIPNSQLIQLI